MYTKTVRKPNKNKRISPSETAFIGAIITLIGGFFISYNYIESQKIMAYDYMANAFYDGNQVTVAENENNQIKLTAISEGEAKITITDKVTGEDKILKRIVIAQDLDRIKDIIVNEKKAEVADDATIQNMI